jgi:hypothetical protein
VPNYSANRRSLQFSDLSQVMPEVLRLSDSGYVQSGRWNLSQTCAHLADWMSYPIHGFPPTPLLIRPFLWVLRHTIAPGQLRTMLQTGRIPSGAPTMRQSVHDPSSEETCACKTRSKRGNRTTVRFTHHPSSAGWITAPPRSCN